MYPGFDGFSHLSDNEVESQLNELTKKYYIVARLQKPEMLTQVATFVTMYKEEMSKRYLNKLKQQDGGDLEQLINVD